MTANVSTVTSGTGYSLAGMLERSVRSYPDRKALIMPDLEITYRELFRQSTRVARGIVALGAKERAHIGILANNGQELVTGLFGTWLANCVAVPINARNKARELRHVVVDADLAVLLTTSHDTSHVDFPALLASAFAEIDRSRANTRHLSIPSAPQLRTIAQLAGVTRPGLLDPDAFFELADSVVVEELKKRIAAIEPSDPAAIMYTSGTTSAPKGCILSHDALSRGPLERANGRLRSREHDVTWGGGPLFHIGSLGPFIGAIGSGGTYLADVAFEPGRALELMTKEGVTVAWPWFPALLEPILDHPEFDPARFSRLSKAMIIAPEPVMRRAQAALPHVELLQACGMTETAGIFALGDEADSLADKAIYQGREVKGMTTRIVDAESGADLRDGEMGEILVRGYCVMDGYYKAPDQTAAALAGGWLHTGDLYRRGKGGRLQFCGRIKDMLKVGGENVAAVEIETFLMTHPAVRTVQVIGVPDARLDEVPVAFVETDVGIKVNEQDLIQFCKGRIASFKVPRAVVFLRADEWPMSLTKIDKRELRNMLNKTEPRSCS